MSTGTLLCVLLLLSITEVRLQFDLDLDSDFYEDYEDPQPLNCSTAEIIRGGNVSYSQGGLKGSVLTYHCSHGYDPFPVSHRLCDADGEWSAMRAPNGRPMSQATCKEKLCPAQLQLQNGDFWPKDQWFSPGTMQSFSCLAGFTLSGSANRTCTFSQEWTGTNPICDNNVDACKDPGVPPGALRSGSRFQVGDRVSYRCQAGLDLLGSSERVCLYSKEWTGAAPRCQAYNGFDSPSAVAAMMTGSLSGVMDALSPEFQKQNAYGRTIDVEEDSRLHIYILLDTSGSVIKHYNDSIKAAISLIRKLDSFDVQMMFHVTSFASKAINIVTITDTFTSTHAGLVIECIQKFNPSDHNGDLGTNLFAGLHTVNEMMVLLKEDGEDNHFDETQNVIVIITDGQSNIGLNPTVALARIRSLLGYSSISNDHTEETLLDVYVFGVGEEINRRQLNAIASKKHKEDHIFILKDHKALGLVFNKMINMKTVTKCGVAKEEDGKTEGIYTRPWQVTLEIPVHTQVLKAKTCYGSVVSQDWILTAAHCFGTASSGEEPLSLEMTVIHGKQTKISTSKIFLHPNYNSKILRHRNVSWFQDFDVALVNTGIPLSWQARPICLPCTTAASRAMRNVQSTCKEHRNELLPHTENLAFFVHKGSHRKETLIHTKEQRQACLSKASWVLKDAAGVTVNELLPERFLCTGGSPTFQTSVSCPGDSGGPLFLRNRMRYFQVGVLSWGIVDPCDPSNRGRPIPADARDFHISLFTIVPWLKKHLGQELEFLPVED